MAKRTALVIAFTNHCDDPRVRRQIETLVQHFDVTAIGAAPPDVPGVEFLLVPGVLTRLPRTLRSSVQLLARRYESLYREVAHVRRSLERVGDRCFDVIIANDVLTLPLAVQIRRGARLVFDAHEYSPREGNHSFLWRCLDRGFNTHMVRTHAPQADVMFTVSDGLARAYRKNFGVRPRVLTNAPAFRTLRPRANGNGQIRMIHHGAAMPARRLENMIEMMRHVDERFRLDVILVPGDPAYISRLHALARDLPSVRFLPKVPMPQLPEFVNEYDLGLAAISPTHLNYRHTLPNKFFEYIQGRIVPVIGPSPEMMRIVTEHECGVVAEDFHARALADAVMAIDSKQVQAMKANVDRAAREHCAEHNVQHLLRAVGVLVDGDVSPAASLSDA